MDELNQDLLGAWGPLIFYVVMFYANRILGSSQIHQALLLEWLTTRLLVISTV